MDQEVMQIMNHIKEGHHFLLSGGAGSGKTYTLVEVIKQIIQERPAALIACITYTNAAVHEIESRVNHENIRVSTIHDFLWDCISCFQHELRVSLVELINDGKIRFQGDEDLPIDINLFENEGEYTKIEYKEYLRVRKGVISHDEVLVLSEYMFAKYPKLCDLVKGSYPFILVDEYQDTSPLVVKILLEHLAKDVKRPYCVGFFGDAMQAIYDNGIGNIDKYKFPDGNVYEVKKEQNRRSPQSVIDLANKIRSDSLTQHPSTDKEAPNMQNGQVKIGKALFLYSQQENTQIEDIRTYLHEMEWWNFDDPSEIKELNLTHKLIAGKAGFRTLMEIHGGDQILKYRDRVHGFIKKHSFQTEGKSFGEVIQNLKDSFTEEKERKKFTPTQQMQDFIDCHSDLFEFAQKLVYDDFINMFVSSDQLVDDKKQDEDENSRTGSKRSDLVRHLMKIERCIHLYSSGDVNGFLKATEKQIKSVTDKHDIHEAIRQLTNVSDKTISEIVTLAHEHGIVVMDDHFEHYKEQNFYVYKRVMDVPYKEVQALYKYLEGMTPFSTQHKTKGAEFDNVLVILDNGNWNNYSFSKLLTASDDEIRQPDNDADKVLRRTQKLFYVCCTRAKENLAVFYHTPSEKILTRAGVWFGEQNVKCID